MIDRLAIIERVKPSSPRFSVSRRLVVDYSSSRGAQEEKGKERRKIRYTRNEMHTFVATCFSPDKHFQESNPQILVQNGDGQTSRDTLLSIAAKHVVTSLDGKGRREIRPDSLKRRGGRGEVTRGEGRRKIDKRKKKRRGEKRAGKEREKEEE